jgi:hypothetical protein
MTQQYIQVGAAPNDGQGTPLRNSFIISNNNFSELYARAQVSPPTTLKGSPGDQPGWYAYSSQYFYYCFAAYDGVNDIWAQLTQTGNVVATQIVNGTSSIKIATANSSATVSIAGVANVVVFQAGGANIAGYVTATGNVRGGNISTTGVISSTGNITSAGNISGNYILGNGSQLTGLASTYNNANVAAFLPTYTGNLSPGAIFTDGYFYANGDPFVGGTNYTDANVAAFLPTYNGDLAGNNLSLTGSATVTGNVDVTGNVNAVVTGQLYGLVNAVNPAYGTWDFGYITANTYSNPIQWIFGQTSLGNINMGTVISPSSISIDIGTIF